MRRALPVLVRLGQSPRPGTAVQCHGRGARVRAPIYRRGPGLASSRHAPGQIVRGTVASGFRRASRIVAPTPPRPRIISAQVSGSGIGGDGV